MESHNKRGSGFYRLTQLKEKKKTLFEVKIDCLLAAHLTLKQVHNVTVPEGSAALKDVYSPLADSFLVFIILAAYSCPVEIFIHRLTTEKAPLQKSHILASTTAF